MRIIALCGSPRKKGNTDLLVDEFLKGAKAGGGKGNKIYLNGLDIRGCQACLSCHKTGKCRQKDDMQDVYRKLLAADLWVISTPVYWWGPTAQMKAAIDRMYCLAFGDNPKKIKGKKVFFITACADKTANATPHLFGMMRESFDFLEMEWAGDIAVQAHKKGDVAENPQELAKARSLGEKVAKG